jgi:hypothetical protein
LGELEDIEQYKIKVCNEYNELEAKYQAKCKELSLKEKELQGNYFCFSDFVRFN